MALDQNTSTGSMCAVARGASDDWSADLVVRFTSISQGLTGYSGQAPEAQPSQGLVSPRAHRASMGRIPRSRKGALRNYPEKICLRAKGAARWAVG